MYTMSYVEEALTKVVNLFGGPGTGKSTLSGEVFVKLKKQGKSTELVREYVKDWAWEGRKITKYDQIYILGKQIKKEALLYNKVDYVITDSPYLLSPFYEEYYMNKEIVLPSALEFMNYAKENGIEYHNFFLGRNKPYDPKGRYENEEEARMIDKAMEGFLQKHNINYKTVVVNDDEKADIILKEIL